MSYLKVCVNYVIIRDTDHPDRKKFNLMTDWLLEKGSKFEKLKLRFYKDDERGVYAKRAIKTGEIIMFIP
jgi:hypothetical protein